jgi:outer membrane protein assembly factor BamB
MYSLALLFLIFFFSSTFPENDKSSVFEFRGKGRTGVYQETNLLKSWPEEGPQEIMTVDNIGNGFVSPVFTGDGFYVTGEEDSACILFSFNMKGEKVWQTTLGEEWIKGYRGTRCTPTITADNIYVGTGMGDLYCVNRKNGKIVWSKDLEKDFGGTPPLHGFSEAPVVDGDRVFWTPGGRVHNVVALDRLTGKIIWSNKAFGETSGYNPGKLITLKDRKIFTTFSMYHFLGLDAKTGELLWSHEQDNYPPEKRGPGYGDSHCNAVIYENGTIWYTEGDGNCCVKLTLSPDGKKITEVWRNKSFDSYMGGVVKLGNYMYCGANARPQLVSINAATGQLTDSLKTAPGAIISADDMLYYYNQKGEMMLLSQDQGKMKLVSSFRVKKGTLQHFAHPVIHEGVLYQRHGKMIIAYDIRKK